MLRKTDEIYDSGKLVAELFKSKPLSLVALFTREGIAFNNTHYVRKVGENYLLLGEDDLAPLSSAVDEWRKVRDSLWGKIAQGHSWCGYLGTDYYAPNSKDAIFIKKGKSPAHLKVGKLEKRINLEGMEFVLERFLLEIKRGKQGTVFDEQEISIVNEIFDLYRVRKGIYAPKPVEGIISSLDCWSF